MIAVIDMPFSYFAKQIYIGLRYVLVWDIN